MIHTVFIDDSSAKGKKLLLNLHKEKDVVRFERPLNSEIINGYITGSEFRESVKQGLINKLKSDGRL